MQQCRQDRNDTSEHPLDELAPRNSDNGFSVATVASDDAVDRWETHRGHLFAWEWQDDELCQVEGKGMSCFE